jgi:hypothetical protein
MTQEAGASIAEPTVSHEPAVQRSVPSENLQLLIPLVNIVPHPENLRDFMQNDKSVGDSVTELKNSIYMQHKTTGRGLVNAITVMPGIDKDTGQPIPEKFFLVDGMQRLNCYKLLNAEYPNSGFDRIPAQVNPKIRTPQDVMVAQLQSNVTRVPTTPKQQARALIRIDKAARESGQPLSAKEIAALFGRSLPWVYQSLRLKDLTETAKQAVDNDDLPVTQASILAKLPQEYQDEFLAEYLTTDDEGRKGWEVKVEGFLSDLKKNRHAKPRLDEKVFNARSKKEIQERYEKPREGDDQKTWRQALEWVGRLDEESELEREAKKAEKEAKKAAANLADLDAKKAQAEKDYQELQAKIAQQQLLLKQMLDQQN